MTTDVLPIRPLVLDDIDAYLRLLQASNAESGVDGIGHSHAYSKSEPYDHAAAVERERTRWSTALDTPGWRRAWGLFDSDTLVGQTHFVGGAISTEMHRVSMGMGILRTHHRRGGGTRLLQTVITWARDQTVIDWIDLGVFGDNQIAHDLYLSHGFHETGRTPDRFRVDGVVLDDISMSLSVSQPT